jgi:DNA-binding response OmpR family regulator
MALQILIIDDDEKLGALLCKYLKEFNIVATAASKPSDGIKLLKARQFDLLVLDLMMPEKDGFEVCKEVRAESSIPIIMLTARGDIADRIIGLELGADDYLAKPFEPRELVARIHAVLRRSDGQLDRTEILKSGDLILDVQKRKGLLKGQDLDLTTSEFDLLHLFMRKSGQALSRDQIMENLKGVEWDVFNRTIDVSLSRLRQKLHDNPKSPEFFKTVWGIGYMFIGSVEKMTDKGGGDGP